MIRDPSQLDGQPFDLLVIGGGIYGAWTAYDASLRGLRVALIEQHDWSSGTSQASSKLIHGGLRYLEHLELGLVRKTLVERRLLAQLGPHRVRPLQFLMALYDGDRVAPWKMRAGLLIYDRIAGGGQPVAAHRPLRPQALLDRLDLEPQGLRGGFSFGDCRTDDTRFTLEIVDGAFRSGVAAVHRMRARRLLTDAGRCVGAEVEDTLDGGTREIRTSATLAACGPWTSTLVQQAGARPLSTRLTKGVHLILPSLGIDQAVVLHSNDDARIVFMIPWYGRTLLGTTDTDWSGDPAEVAVDDDDVRYLLERVHRVFRSPRWTADDVIHSIAGLRTLPGSGAAPSDISREWTLLRPMDGLWAMVGGKFTSARADAATTVDRIVASLGMPQRSAPTARLPLPWSPDRPFDAWLESTVAEATELGMDGEAAHCAALRQGNRMPRLLELIRGDPSLARRHCESAPFARAELQLAARDEMVVSLEDLVRRRVPLLLTCGADPAMLESAARLVGEQLGWDRARQRNEVASLVDR